MPAYARDLVTAIDPVVFYGLQILAGNVVKLEGYEADGAFNNQIGSLTLTAWGAGDGPWTPIHRAGTQTFAWRTVNIDPAGDPDVDPTDTRLWVMDFEAGTVTALLDSRAAPWDGDTYSRYVAPYDHRPAGKILWIESDGIAEGANAVRLHADDWSLDNEEILQTIEPSSMGQIQGVAWGPDRAYVVLPAGLRIDLPFDPQEAAVEYAVDYTGDDQEGVAYQNGSVIMPAVRDFLPSDPSTGDIYGSAGDFASFSTLVGAAGGFQARTPAVAVRPIYIDVKRLLGEDEPAELLIYDNFTDLKRYLADPAGAELIESIAIDDSGPEGITPDLLFYV